jgi:hypothetical protein
MVLERKNSIHEEREEEGEDAQLDCSSFGVFSSDSFVER